jgi:hypothetical protein
MEVQDTLALLADPRNVSQGAAKSVHSDRMLVKKAVAKYRQLISQYEAQKQVHLRRTRNEYILATNV